MIDEGIGIPEADVVRIFDRFARGSNVAGRITGNGVGLTMVRQIVAQHGGSMRLPLVSVPAALTAAN